MAAGVGVEGRDADQPVHAGLGLGVAVGVRSLEAERRALDARALPRLKLEQLRLEAASLRPAQVHPQQHLGPVLRLEAAGAGMDLDDGVAGVVLAAEELLELELVEALGDRVHLRSQLLERLGVALLRELEIHLRLVDPFALPPPAGDGRLHASVLARHRLRALGIVPEVGRRRLLAQLGGALLESGEVKDASRVSRPARRARGPARAVPQAAWRRLTPCPAP